MTPRDFSYWLQGFFEISNEDVTLSHRQIQIIKDHLNLVLNKETPDRSTEEGGDDVPPDKYPQISCQDEFNSWLANMGGVLPDYDSPLCTLKHQESC